MRRTPQHLDKHGTDYPDAVWYLHYQGKYLFRALPLRHLRIEQFNHAWPARRMIQDDRWDEWGDSVLLGGEK